MLPYHCQYPYVPEVRMEVAVMKVATLVIIIMRLERDTSVDRLSTGSRESNMSTQSEWVAGEKKKKGLIGKLKNLTRKSEDKEFGSGSDISDISKTSVASSAMSAFQKVQQKRSASKDRSKITNKPPEEANQPFDKLFGSKDGQGASA